MGEFFQIALPFWQRFLNVIREKYKLYAPLRVDHMIDYSLIKDTEDIHRIIYNQSRPVSPLKLFFLPVKENVVKEEGTHKEMIILGTPSCDLEALGILDEFYLSEPFVDQYYKRRRESTLLIGTDCFDTEENCHCNTYGFSPYPENFADISLSLIGEFILLDIKSEKGEYFIDTNRDKLPELHKANSENVKKIQSKRTEITNRLSAKNAKLPDYVETGNLVGQADDQIWDRYSKTCVACGACATICPTCSCFLLVDRPGFEKVRQMDACQYPGFVRVAGGEDAFSQRSKRFKNRYLCKYVYKPSRFESVACTGCGRCIDACIGRINKNEIFLELAENRVH